MKILLIYSLPGRRPMSFEVAMLLLCESPTCIYVILGCHSMAGRVLKGNGYGKDHTSCFLLKPYTKVQYHATAMLLQCSLAIHLAAYQMINSQVFSGSLFPISTVISVVARRARVV